jgi:hypothetical protein
MSTDRTLKVEGGDWYGVSEYQQWFFVYKLVYRTFSTEKVNIGKARTFSDAVELVKSHSGQPVVQIE